MVNFIRSVTDLTRDAFTRGKYQNVILPLTVLRQLDRVLAPKKQKVFVFNRCQGSQTTFIATETSHPQDKQALAQSIVTLIRAEAHA